MYIYVTIIVEDDATNLSGSGEDTGRVGEGRVEMM